MKIGDTVFIHGYIDEIRKDMVIIRNNGGYFGTVPSEIICGEMPERKTGKWIDDEPFVDYYYAHCSECGYQMNVNEERGYFNFCPDCGADMRGEEHGQDD